MIGKVCRRGSSVRRLLGYLFTEGLAGQHGLESEHHDAHVIAGYEPAELLEPARDARGRAQLSRFAALLDAPVKAGGVGPDAKPVYHLAISAAPGDRRLTDAEWADIAGQYVHALGLAPQGDPDGVRWIAVRHADNHVHVVATLVRQDGRRVFPHHDFYRARETSLAVEQQYGLTRTSPVDRTAVAETTRAEQRKHLTASRARARVGLPPPPGPDRDVLRTRVRAALAGSDGWGEFADRLRASGVLVRERYSTVTPGQLTGYAVALTTTGARARAGQAPVWFGGGKLAPDLSLPQLQARWGTPAGPPAAVGVRAATGSASLHGRDGSPVAGPGRGLPAKLTADERRQLWQLAQDTVTAAIEQLRQAADTPPGGAGHAEREAAAQAAASTAGEAVSALGRLLEGGRGGPLTDASTSWARAARAQHRRTVPATPISRRLRTVAGLFRHAHIVQKGETRQLVELLERLSRLAATLAALREAQQRAAQANAALRAAEQLRLEQQRRSAAAATVFAASFHQTTTVLQPAAYRPTAQTPRSTTRSR